MDLSGHLLEKLQEDSGFTLFRAALPDGSSQVLLRASTLSARENAVLPRFEHELSLGADLDGAWVVLPRVVSRHNGRTFLVLEDSGGQPLDRLLGKPLHIRTFLNLAAGIAAALKRAHARGLIHKDIKPANVWVGEDGQVRLTGFGIASRQPRERQAVAAPEIIAGTLAYMAPEQTGRMNRSIDNRSDLYSLGITLYEMLVGSLPFNAGNPVEWVHCHVARQPSRPTMRVDGIPPVVEEIVLKLLAKNAEDRYQTAAGLERDLRRCLGAVLAGKGIEKFELASDDLAERFQLPEKLYSRSAEIELLAKAFGQVSSHGQFELVLLSGYSGVGKSSVVEEFRRRLYPTCALFAAGKADQYKQNTPYATLAEAFQGLLSQILSQDEAGLGRWRGALAAAVGANGRLMIDLFSDLALILGPQPELTAVSPQEAQNRFKLTFRRFVAAFAQPDHPLVLFLDDLQWLDAETLELLLQFSVEDEIPCLMLIGAYRSNAVRGSDPLIKTIEKIAAVRGSLKEIRLSPLAKSDVVSLVADALRADVQTVRSLADLVFEKTHGNPFFVLQFLATLIIEGLLTLDSAEGGWRWDLDRIRNAAITDNVADLMAAKLVRYEPLAVAVIKQFACLGSSARKTVLALLLDASEAAVEEALRKFVADGLLHHVDRGYAFVHDGVREAAYALVDESERAAMHLRIGRLLSNGFERKEIEDGLFEIVGQLNRGATLIDSEEESLRLAELNLAAGKRAIATAAYGTALTYLDAGCALVPPIGWISSFRTNFELQFHQADCLFMTGNVAGAEQHLEVLAQHCEDLADHALIVSRQSFVYAYQGRLDLAIQLVAACAARMGQLLPTNVGQNELEREYEAFARRLDGRSIESIFDLPLMTDPHWLQVMDVLESLLVPAAIQNADLQVLTVLRMANISLDHGLSHETAHIFSNLAGLVLGWRFGDFKSGHRFARLALRLTDERGLDRYAARLYTVISGTVGPWSMPLRECFNLAMRALDMGREQGGVTYAGYAWSTALVAALDGCKPLSEVHRLAETGLVVMRKLNFSLAIEFVTIVLQTTRALRGMTNAFGSFTDDAFSEYDYENFLRAQAHLWHALIRFRIRKVQMQYLAGNYVACLEIVSQLEPEIEPIKVFERAEYSFFSALSRAAFLTNVPSEAWSPHFAAIVAARDQLSQWAALCPENFGSRACLINAEIARLEGRELEAQRLYEEAIQLAIDEEMISVEALGYELAARFYRARGFDTIAQAYLRNARASYGRWGADGKVAQLDQAHPDLGRERTGRAVSGMTSGALFHNLDLSAIVEMYQAVSGEIVLDRLIEQLMVTVVEQAGAVRGLMLLPREGGIRIVAEAVTREVSVEVVGRQETKLAGELPTSILNFVTRTRESVILDDAQQANIYSSDPYLLVSKPRSILCLPLVKQARLVAILYLENALASHMFTPSRLAILQLLTAQAAISIENAELFLQAKDAQDHARQVGNELKRSFDMIPTLAWRTLADGQFEFANKQWHDYTGDDANEPALCERWRGICHPDDVEKVWGRCRHLLEFGVSGEVEIRLRRYDGEFRRFLMRVEPMRDETGTILKWHGTCTDIEDIKLAEQAQEALARVSRVTAMGELTVSIAHEVNQPLMAIVTNAATCLRWLAEERLDLGEARLAAQRIIRDGHRAGEVIASIRAMARKSQVEMVAVDLNDAIREVLQLTRNELDQNGITVDTRLTPDIGLAFADRVQMQQVILNLVMNGIEAMVASKGRKRKLRITSKRVGTGSITISISDTGAGLDPLVADRIFEAFFTTKPGGVGMGLSICRTIIEAHGGRLLVKANHPRGAIFGFSVPAFVEERSFASAS